MILINQKLLDQVSAEAKAKERQRQNFNFHICAEDTLHRMLNAVEPGSYVCPHLHANPDKREAFIILQGKMLVVLFDKQGNITEHTILHRASGNFGIEIPPDTYHTIVALEPNTVVYEVKDGPYLVSTDKGFAPWAPIEGSSECQLYLSKLLQSLNIPMPHA
jgi:cupin fold WbuC family metalloprotein